MTKDPKKVVTETKEAVVSKDQKQAAGSVAPATPVKKPAVEEVDRARD